jgi:hypothetical protein
MEAQMEGLPTQPVFSVGARAFLWDDVVAAARRWGTWATVERRTREGIACRRRAEREGDPLRDADVDRAASAFRYEHGLLSADELRAWLDRWGLTQAYWMEYIRRALLREHWSHELATLIARHPVADEEVAAFLLTEAVCSGALQHEAVRLAQRAAVADAVAGDPAADLHRLEAWFERFCADAASPQAIEREVHARHVDWLRLECRLLSHGEPDVVREAALCVREDGRDLADVAAEAGAHVEVAQTLLEAAEPSLRAQLLGARRGDLVGPLALGDRYQLIEVLDKQVPTAEDPDIRDRAAEAIVRRAVEGEVANRVRWHEHVQD